MSTPEVAKSSPEDKADEIKPGTRMRFGSFEFIIRSSDTDGDPEVEIDGSLTLTCIDDSEPPCGAKEIIVKVGPNERISTAFLRVGAMAIQHFEDWHQEGQGDASPKVPKPDAPELPPLQA